MINYYYCLQDSLPTPNHIITLSTTLLIKLGDYMIKLGDYMIIVVN